MVTNLRAFLTTALLLILTTGVRTYAEDAANHYPFAAGTIQKLDANARLVTILTPKGSQTLALTDRTYLYRGKDKLTPDKLKVGDSIKINYYTNDTGQAFIRRLKVDQASPSAEHPPQ